MPIVVGDWKKSAINFPWKSYITWFSKLAWKFFVKIVGPKIWDLLSNEITHSQIFKVSEIYNMQVLNKSLFQTWLLKVYNLKRTETFIL